jgi:hypothetical protein
VCVCVCVCVCVTERERMCVCVSVFVNVPFIGYQLARLVDPVYPDLVAARIPD